MDGSVQLTQADIKALFERWNKESELGGWDKNPVDPELQAEYFFQIAKELVG